MIRCTVLIPSRDPAPWFPRAHTALDYGLLNSFIGWELLNLSHGKMAEL